ncbi:hypothetical protein Scep_001728 [Stephania cephalantha]|uniref:Uncharacterized protein n=1 Tax=Stephania cephalantha TaxID=152367 RepID=A0AAP0Q3M6_9MAGN
MYAGNPTVDSSYSHNYGRFEDSHYYNVNGVGMSHNGYQFSNMHSFVQHVEVCEICGDYSHSAHNCPYYPQYENYHYCTYALPQPDFFGLLSNPQVHQSTSMEDMIKQLIDNQQKVNRILEEIRQIDFEIPGLKDLETQFIQYNVRLQNMTYEEELCSTEPIFNPEEDVSVDTLKNFEVNEVTHMEDYWRETSEEYKLEKPQIESEEDQPLVLVQPPTLPCICGTPYKGVKVKERSQIFYTANTIVLDDLVVADYFVLEVPNELLNLKEGVHASMPKYVDAPFVVDISNGKGIT